MARILLIDDEDTVRFSFRQVLEEAGHDVFEASDGEEGVDEFKKMTASYEGPHVVITDIIMPNKSGYDLIKEIKTIMPGVKILAISGGGNTDSKVFLDISSVLGANQVLSKPVLAEDLLSAVERCLE